MVPRLWVCTEQPLILSLLAAPLHPLALLTLISVGLVAALASRKVLAKALLRAALISSIVLICLIVVFAISGGVMGAAGNNPTAALRFASWAWAGAGLLLLAYWGFKIAVSPAGALAEAVESSSDSPSGCAVTGSLWLSLLLALSGLVTIASRHWISDRQLLSAPYRLVEWSTDLVKNPVSDACLASRVLEYGSGDPVIGRKATWALEARHRSAVAGVVARLHDARKKWPPPEITVSPTGLAWLLKFARDRGAGAAADEWNDIDWKRDAAKANRRRSTPSLSH